MKKKLVIISQKNVQVENLPLFHGYKKTEQNFHGKTKNVFKVIDKDYVAYFHSRKKFFMLEFEYRATGYIFSSAVRTKEIILRQKTLANDDYMAFTQEIIAGKLVKKSLTFAFGEEIFSLTAVLEDGKWITSGNIKGAPTRWRNAVING